ncbi:MAG: hypothetical protein EXR67_05490 [Dehalococcoidia bacterium]|nr:hypothetical protein [Dehalococcoidia bacterium]
MLNRQIGLLFLVGVAIAVASVVATSFGPLPANLQATQGVAGTALRGLFVVSLLLVTLSQVLVMRSAFQVKPTGQSSTMRTNRGMELLWSLLPGAMVIAGVVYALQSASS